MQQADPIEFENADLMRAFRAEFYDQAVHKVHQDTKLTLMCATCATGSACDGVCTDLMADVYAVSYGLLLHGPGRRIGCASVDADDQTIDWTL